MSEEIRFDLQTALGAKSANSLQKFAIYLPNRDRDEKPVPDIESWITAGMQILVDLIGGVTRMPEAWGEFKVVDEGVPARIVREDTTVIYSYIFDFDSFQRDFSKIRAFVHSFGKSANQKAVMVEYLGENPEGGSYTRAYYIEEYAAAA